MLSVNKETLAVLQRLGLNQYESKTYFALVSSRASTATELSDVANIPRPRVYDVLTKLEKKGFIVTQPGRPAKYAAVPVSTAIGTLKREKKEALEKNISELESLEKRLSKRLDASNIPITDEGDVFVITDRKSIYSALEELIKKSKSHVLLASNKQGLARKREQYGSLLHLAQKRGVSVRLVESPKRAAVVDDHTFIFLNNGLKSGEDKAAWIRSPFVAKAMREVL